MTTSSAIDVLDRFGFGHNEVRLAERFEGFSGAVVFRFESSLGEYALRGWPPNGLPRERLLGLHGLLAHVFDRGVTEVSVPSRAAAGGTLVESEGRLWQVEPWKRGVADLRVDPSPVRVSAAVTTLARFHQAAESFDPPIDATRWFGGRGASSSPAVHERLQRIEEWRAVRAGPVGEALRRDRSRFGGFAHEVDAAFERSAENVARELAGFSRTPFRLLPCLRDVHGEHVLMEGERVGGLIDPSACRVESVATDLARLLGDVLADDREARGAALDTYARVRSMTIAELHLVDVLDRSAVLLMGTTWLDRCYRKGLPVDCDERVLERLERLVPRLHGLP